MKFVVSILLPFLVWAPAGFAQTGEDSSAPVLFEKKYLYEVVRHLYRWYLDETDIEKIAGRSEIDFWVKESKPALDPGDHSRFGEIVIPDLNIQVLVKKPDYVIEELGLTVRSDVFKIIHVARGKLPSDPSGYRIVTVVYKDLLDYAYQARSRTRFPEDPLLTRMRLSARKKILDYLQEREKAHPEDKARIEELKKQDQAVHLAPLSDVANEVWVFWETGRMLIHFSSDLDLENPSLWERDELAVKLVNIDEQTVVSLDEVAGSNAYMTRDQVGRALYNCIILGRRLVLQPSENAPDK
jgi:hypothetical protein